MRLLGIQVPIYPMRKGDAMELMNFGRKAGKRSASVLLSTLLTIPMLAACGSGSNQANLPPSGNSGSGPYMTQRETQVRRGLNNKQKVAILAGAAALYYLYNQHRNRQAQGPQGQYYLSKNGRVYYRDAQGRPQWVTPPKGGIRVPAEEAERYREFQGYNGRQTGRDLTDLSAQPSY